MIQIRDKIISLELFETNFKCHLNLCLGNCCVYGDSGAPLEDNEVLLLEKYYTEIKDFIPAKGKAAINKQNSWVTDRDGDKVTPLVNGKECAYAYFQGGTAFCGIEKAWEKRKIPLRKPLSCHLYPIRVSKIGEMTALNYHRWPICNPARILGNKEGIPVFRFVKESLTRAYGKDFYEEMERVYRELKE